MTESAEAREYIADWLRQVPDFMVELGLEDRPDLASRLRYLGSGGRAQVVSLGTRNGVQQVLKVTNDSAQAVLSQAALEDEPVGVVPIYEVVATDIAPRGERALPDLPREGEAPVSVARTWGIVEKFVVPFEAFYQLDDDEKVCEDLTIREALDVYKRASDAYGMRLGRASDPLVEDWRLTMEAAIQWVEETCEALGSSTVLDLHAGNWGVDPNTCELVLLDLGQCYAHP